MINLHKFLTIGNKHNTTKCAMLVACAIGTMVSCSTDENLGQSWDDENDIIHVGGVSLCGLTTSISTATRATTVIDIADDGTDYIKNWVRDPLFLGWDVTYYLPSVPDTKYACTLKLMHSGDEPTRDANGLPIYELRYKSDNMLAKWQDNGAHIFQGVYFPDKLKEKDDNEDGIGDGVGYGIALNQSNDSKVAGSEGNYTILERYLAMPQDCRLTASVARVELPYKHRLSRLLLFTLLDPEMKNKEGKMPKITSIQFSKVDVLDYVDANGHPIWKKADEVVPHSLGNYGSVDKDGNALAEHCIVFYNEHKGYYVTPTSSEWTTANTAWNNGFNAAKTAFEDAHSSEEFVPEDSYGGYTKTDYGKVPVYDLIIRPTYTNADSVMYDEIGYPENKATIAGNKNTFEVTVTLDNGLVHTSSITVDINANHQICGYLRVTPEGVDYDESLTETWIESESEDDWYGVNNREGHSLSKTGSSWQRAFRNTTLADDNKVTDKDDKVTDGHLYETTDDDEADDAVEGKLKTQYLSDDEWIAKFLQAKAGGKYHGCYFILDHDITLTLTADFVFTGHLDAMDHKITITGNGFAGLNGVYTTNQEANSSLPANQWEANVHMEGSYWVPRIVSSDFGYRAEILNAVIDGEFFTEGAYDEENKQYKAPVTGYIYNCRKANTTPVERYPQNMKGIPQY